MPPSALPTPDASAPSPEALETEITTLAAHLNAGTFRFLVLIADFDRLQGWGGWGIRSCAHWLNWKCGIGLNAAREQLRVAHALGALPQVSEAMRQGELSYTKVRAITRVATADNEACLLAIARNGTASHVETVVRHYRRSKRIEELQRDTQRHDARSLRYFWDHDGCLVIEARLPPEQGALVVQALRAADEALRPHPVPVSAPSRRAAAPDDQPTKTAALIVAPACGAISTPDETGEQAGCVSMPMDHGPADAPLPTAPGVAEWVEPTWIGWDVSAVTRAAPLGWVQRQADAFVRMAETLLASGPSVLKAGDRHLVHVRVDLDALCDAQDAGTSAIEDGPRVPPETVRRLCCDGGLVTWLCDGEGNTIDVGRKTRVIPAALRRLLERRDGGCRFPGCEQRRFVDAHHIQHWADGGRTDADNLVLLCRYHHRVLHEGGYRVSGDARRPVFTDADGCVVRSAPSVPRLAQGHALVEQHAARGLDLNARTAIPGWGGERADYTWMLTILDQHDRRAQRGCETQQ